MLERLRALALLTPEQNERCAPPDTLLMEHDGGLWERISDTADWIPLGVAPRPTTRRGWFVHHLCNGVLMRYPLRKVVLFSLLHTEPGGDDG